LQLALVSQASNFSFLTSCS